MGFWQVFGIVAAVTIPSFILLWIGVDLLARHIVKKKHEKGRLEGKTDEEIAYEYIMKTERSSSLFLIVVFIILIITFIIIAIIKGF